MSDKRVMVQEPVIEDGVLDGGMVEVRCDISKGRGADKVTLFEDFEHRLDLTGLTVKELVHLATATVVIKLQSGWRELGTKAEADNGKTTNVHEFVNRPINRTMRPAEDILLDKVEKGEISGEALEQLIEQLKAKAAK